MALLFTTTLLVGCGSGSSSEPPAATKATVLVYIEGTNLEDGTCVDETPDKTFVCSWATKNIQEMLKATSSSNVNVVLQTGAADKAVVGEPVDNWRTVRRYVVENQKLVLKDDTLGAKDMGDPKVLTDFITWGQKTYKADKYVLIFWDHGGGVIGGFGGHRVKGEPGFASPLSVTQLKAAVEAAVGNNPANQFELIGFDTCLMATLEVAQAFKGTARYLAASQDVEPGPGWDWTPILNLLAANPGADGAAIGIAIADSYKAKMVTLKQNWITFSVINLAKIDGINTALAAMSKKYSTLLAGSGDGPFVTWSELAMGRSIASDYLFEAVDLLSMFPASDGPEEAALAKATADAVVKSVVGSEIEPVSGLNVMFPTYSVWKQDDELAIYAGLNFLVPEYQALVKNYSDYSVSSVHDLTFGPASLTNSKTMAAKITSANPDLYEQVYVAIHHQLAVISDGKEVTQDVYRGHQPVWSTSKDFSEFSYTSDSKWFMLGGKLASMTSDPTKKKGIQTIRIPVSIERTVPKGGNCSSKTLLCMDGTYDVSWNFDTDKLNETIGFVEVKNNQAIAPQKLSKGDRVFLKYFDMPAAGGATVLGKWKAIDDEDYKFTVGDSEPVFAKAAIPAGKDFAFFGFDLRMKQFVSSSVKLQ